MIRFSKIEIEGFGSIHDPLTFELDLGPTLSVIRGDVGNGKTSIPSAIYWCLYGRHLKEKATVETWPELRLDSYKGTKVSIYFYKDNDPREHKATRCKSYKGKIAIKDDNGKTKKVQGGNHLFYFKGGELVKNKKGVRENANIIEKDLGYSADLFKNSIIFGQKMKRIIEETGPNKKKVFEEAFEVSFIDEAKDKEDKEKDKLINALSTVTNQLEDLNDKLESAEELKKDYLNTENNFEKTKANNIKKIAEQITETKGDSKELKTKLRKYSKADISTLEDKLTELNKTYTTRKKLTSEYADILENKETLEELISKLKSVVNKRPELCPSCKMPLGEKGYKNIVKENKAKIAENEKLLEKYKISVKSRKAKNKEYLDSLPDLKVEINNLEKQINIYEVVEDEITETKSRLTKLKSRLTKLKSELKAAKKSKIVIKSEKYSIKIKRFKKQIKTLKKQQLDLQHHIDLKKWLITDPLSNNGLKAYMFDNLMSKVNERLDEYSEILGFQVEFGINLDTHRKDFYQMIQRDGIIIPYEDLSGGQKQIVDTTIAFAIHDVISEIRPTNIMFLDEPFESLGVNEIDVISDLVQEKAKEKSLFLITHHQGFNPLNVNEIQVILDENKHTKIY